MTTAIKIIVAVILAIALVVGVQKCRDSNARERNTDAETKLQIADSVAAVAADTVKAKEPAHDRTGHALSEVLHRAPVPKPKVATGGQIRTDTVTKDTTQYVTLASYNELEYRLDSTVAAATVYQFAAEGMIAAQRKLIVAQQNVIVSAKNVIENPKPSRRWGIGLHAGYGGTLHNGLLVQGPQGGVSVSYRIF